MFLGQQKTSFRPKRKKTVVSTINNIKKPAMVQLNKKLMNTYTK